MILDPANNRDQRLLEFRRRHERVAEELGRYKRELLDAGLSEAEAWALVQRREVELLGGELQELEDMGRGP